ncbi:MAG TPA: hypothetical protein VHQ90_00835 [Thermoanaerobaculia bacterium]|nr:hypothetical protein [Thermoanaerobaculia bacterium]
MTCPTQPPVELDRAVVAFACRPTFGLAPPAAIARPAFSALSSQGKEGGFLMLSGPGAFARTLRSSTPGAGANACTSHRSPGSRTALVRVRHGQRMGARSVWKVGASSTLALVG